MLTSSIEFEAPNCSLQPTANPLRGLSVPEIKRLGGKRTLR